MYVVMLNLASVFFLEWDNGWDYMKIIFFGLGSIAKRHARILKKKYKYTLYAFRSGTYQSDNELDIPELYSWEEVEGINPDVAFIIDRTSMHIDTAIACAQRGMHLFIEKPLDSDIKDLRKLLNIVSKKKIALKDQLKTHLLNYR